LAQIINHILHHLGELGTFRGSYPGKTKAFRFQVEILQHQVQGIGASFGAQIAFTVVAIPRVASAHQDAIGTLG
jgi:hypothetical protein